MTTKVISTTKVVSDTGEVAVLYSPGWGAGWSTWNAVDNEMKNFLMFDASLIAMADRNASSKEVKAYLDELNIGYIFCGGWEDIEIAWVPVHTPFVIEEVDGSEYIVDESYLIFEA